MHYVVLQELAPLPHYFLTLNFFSRPTQCHFNYWGETSSRRSKAYRFIVRWWVMAELYTWRQTHNSHRRRVIKNLTEYFSALVTNRPATQLSEIPGVAEALAGRLWRPRRVHLEFVSLCVCSNRRGGQRSHSQISPRSLQSVCPGKCGWHLIR